MALIECPECGGHVSTEASSCPHCGFPIESVEVDDEPTLDAESFRAVCPNCEANYVVREDKRGRTIACRKCKAPFLLEPDDVAETELLMPQFTEPSTYKTLVRKKTNSNLSVVLGVVFGGFSLVIILVCCGGGFGGGGASRTAMAGDIAVITDECFVAATSADLDRVTQLSVAKDNQGISAMILSGRIRIVAAGTEVRIIDPGMLRYEIRLSDGSSGFLSPEFLEKK